MREEIRYFVENVRTIMFANVLNGRSLPIGTNTDQHFLEPDGQNTQGL